MEVYLRNNKIDTGETTHRGCDWLRAERAVDHVHASVLRGH